MIEVPLQDTANQSFSVQLDGSRYEFTLKECAGVMCADVSRDEVVLLTGSRVVAGTPIIPYRYLQTGNFLILTENDDLPYYSDFGVGQSLVYLSADELAELGL